LYSLDRLPITGVNFKVVTEALEDLR